MSAQGPQHWRARRTQRRLGGGPAAWQGEFSVHGRQPQPPSAGRRAPRVVFLPGAMGSVLIDSSLTPQQAQQVCRANLGAWLDRKLRGTDFYPCDKGPEQIWDSVGSAHWLLNPSAWEARMRSGNGLDAPGNVRRGNLFEAELRFRGRHLVYKPYTTFVSALRRAGADVLVFPYDWRLGCRYNALILQQAIVARWFGGRAPDPGGRLDDAERITFIGHSMGGLVARYFLESPLRGHVVARRLVTIGTPHLGAPQSWLHFSGRTVPFSVNPFYAASQDVLKAELSSAGAQAQAVSAQIMPGGTQTAVVRHMGSIVELLPIYDFVTDKGKAEPFAKTYQGAVHSGTQRPAIDLVQAFRNSVVAGPGLDRWLGQHGLEYHFLAATDFTTPSGYERSGNRIVTTTSGDGTVPLRSAHVVQKSTPRVQAVTLGRGSDQLGHPRLCERRDVQAYCVKAIGLPPQGPLAVPGRPLSADFVAMARTIMRSAKVPGGRGVVLSVAYLRARDGRPLIDTTLAGSSGGSLRPKLKNPPKHVPQPAEVHEVRSPRHGTFRYVWMDSNAKARWPVGGMVFLPAIGASDLWVVTFNVGELTKGPCTNEHHAEMQLMRWIIEQPIPWQAGISGLRLHNRSRRGPSRGFSPCNACCDDLAKFLVALNGLQAPLKMDAGISWEMLYEGRADCGYPTNAKNIQRLKDSGWGEPQGPRPVAAPAPRRTPVGPGRRRTPAGVP